MFPDEIRKGFERDLAAAIEKYRIILSDSDMAPEQMIRHQGIIRGLKEAKELLSDCIKKANDGR